MEKNILTNVSKLNDEEIKKYVNESFTEQLIRRSEDEILAIMKLRQENHPTEKNDKEWLDFSNYVCKRRNKD